ncbi:MAG: hypothetical protein NT151_08090 [Acidobacteria bacterium]|nr:hypothetical protein [Acidobacteriota bacterium]
MHFKQSGHTAAILVFLALFVTPAAWAAGPAPQSPARPGGPLVTVDFRAVTGDSSPLIDLKVADVTLKVDGREREIRSFELIQSRGKSGGAARAAIPAPFATNALATRRRDTLLVIDDESIQPGAEQTVKLAAEQYLSSLAAGDRAGALTVQGSGINMGLTDQHAAIRSALAGMVGRGRRAEADEDSACRTRRVLDALVSVAGNFPPGGAPVTVLFFSTGLTAPGVATLATMRSNSVSNPTGMCEIQARDYQQLQAAALTSAVNIYVVDAADTSASSLGASNRLQAGLEHLAGVGGNRLIQPIRNGERDIARVVRENSVWYRAAFEPDTAERNGSTHRVELQVKRSGVDVSVRPMVLIPKAGGQAAAAKAPAARDMLREAKGCRDLELRAAAFASREAGTDKIKLVVLFEPVDPAVVLKSAVVGLYDQKGRLTVQGTAEAANLVRKLPTIALLASPGVYRMRVAATDASDRGGTVDTDVTVALTRAEPLQLGSLILGLAEAGSFTGRLTFTTEPLAIGYLEVYGVGKAAQLSASVDVAESEDGPPLVQGSTKIVGEGTDDARVILGGVPIGPFPPGDLLVRLVVSLDGKPVGRAIRTLRKGEGR